MGMTLLPLKVMPNVLLGVWKWDNWLLDTLIRGGNVPVIGGTSLIDAIHLRLNNVSHEARDGYDVNQALYVQYFKSIGVPTSGDLVYPYPTGLGSISSATYSIKNHSVVISKSE